MLPLLIFAGLEIGRLHESRRQVHENALFEQARSKAQLIDEGFARIVSAIYALSASTALDEKDFDRFDREYAPFRSNSAACRSVWPGPTETRS